MLIKVRNFFSSKYNINFGNNLFLIGIFFLPSALPISALFLLISLIISLKNKHPFSLKDKWNLPLYISIGLIIFSTINITFFNRPLILLKYDIPIIWINLVNWLPTFLFYWGFQNYLRTDNQRLIFAKYLISGTLPVIATFIAQKFFNLYGPYKTLYGLVIWFQKPLMENYHPIAGLFSNVNYAGIWLALTLPFSIHLLQISKGASIFKKLILFIFSFLIFYMILLTGSRNGLLGIIITFLFLYSFKRIILIIGSISAFFITYKFIGITQSHELKFLNYILPSHLFSRLNELNIYNTPRLDIWESALSRIIERPLLGWGPSTFSFLHIENNDTFKIPYEIINAQHAHNIALEIAHNFGIPLSIILISTIFLILIKSWKSISISLDSKDNFLLKKAWLASSSIVFVSHLSDITYFDGKINILISILFAGLKCIINK